MKRFQIVIAGSGFGGSLLAMIAAKLGYSTALVERGRHPRFVIGESSTPLTNLLLEEIAERYQLDFLRPLCKWGSWQKEMPGLPCGLKRGFSFYHHTAGHPFQPDPGHHRQLLVGASPVEAVADTHWYRPEFDRYLVGKARELGVVFWDDVELSGVAPSASGVGLSGARHGETFEISADFLIDATGPRGLLHRAFNLPEKEFATMPATRALFTHFTGVGPLPGVFSDPGLPPPFPPEQAAVHHVFDEGWVWVLKFNHGLTSAGVVARDRFADRVGFGSGEAGWRGFLSRFPSLAGIFAGASPALPFRYQPRVAFQSGVLRGPCWALLPSAAGVVDPLLSTGFPLTLLGVLRLGQCLGEHWRRPSFDEAIEDYARRTAEELEVTARLVAALYASMGDFETFARLTLLYFAAASFAEAARRLGRTDLAGSFLLCRDPRFAPLLLDCCRLAQLPPADRTSRELRDQIRRAVEPIDLAGLTDEARNNWFPAQTSDLLDSCGKLGAAKEEVARMLRQCGLS